MAKKTGIELITHERQKQIEKHGYTVDVDVRLNNHYQLSAAVGMLVWLDEEDYGHDVDACRPPGWNIEPWRKMMAKPYIERLAIAGAMCAAEIDRLNALDY